MSSRLKASNSLTLNQQSKSKPIENLDEGAVERLNQLIPHANAGIRGLNETLIGWDGNQWGLVPYEADGNFILKSICDNTSTFCTVTIGNLQPNAGVKR